MTNYLTFNELHARGIVRSRTTLARYIKKYNFPKPYKIGPQRIAFKESEVQAWVDGNQPQTTEQTAA